MSWQLWEWTETLRSSSSSSWAPRAGAASNVDMNIRVKWSGIFDRTTCNFSQQLKPLRRSNFFSTDKRSTAWSGTTHVHMEALHVRNQHNSTVFDGTVFDGTVFDGTAFDGTAFRLTSTSRHRRPSSRRKTCTSGSSTRRRSRTRIPRRPPRATTDRIFCPAEKIKIIRIMAAAA